MDGWNGREVTHDGTGGGPFEAGIHTFLKGDKQSQILEKLQQTNVPTSNLTYIVILWLEHLVGGHDQMRHLPHSYFKV